MWALGGGTGEGNFWRVTRAVRRGGGRGEGGGCALLGLLLRAHDDLGDIVVVGFVHNPVRVLHPAPHHLHEHLHHEVPLVLVVVVQQHAVHRRPLLLLREGRHEGRRLRPLQQPPRALACCTLPAGTLAACALPTCTTPASTLPCCALAWRLEAQL